MRVYLGTCSSGALRGKPLNRRHKMVGHLLQGRYKAILVQKNAHLSELTRYVVLHPIRAGRATELKDWRWSSYPTIVGLEDNPEWLDADWLLSQFAKYRKTARKRYH